MSHRSNTSRILKVVSMGALFGALAFAAGCGTHKYLNFQVWEGPGQTSEAHKSFDADLALGGYHDQVWDLLGKNDVDGAIKLIEAEQQKNQFDYYNLAILYEVKHDWAKAEENMKAAIAADKGMNPSYQNELAYIQDHKARYVGAPAAPAAATPAAPAPAATVPLPGGNK